ncbi:hypothetical protein LVJ85_11520 [Neisseria sp. Dent CA1/247]|uniref:hypothetical protein n=1 Tax=Neisseria sp. Dent CA1/247 TaxID=2912675 RepID=UPI001FD0D6EE|nr:hypothetical protein [Neisseria sp. Dent CA1/247]UOO76618.1 hypothetical protein LVJ85_11520 [Neisseria sp. Dent CA1/247]
MDWPIPDIPEVVKLEKYRFDKPLFWFAGLFIIFLLSVPVILSLWQNRPFSLLFWVLLFGVPLLLWGSLRLMFFSWEYSRKSQFDAWEVEKNRIRQHWQNWAQKNIAVVGSGIYLPESLNVSDVLAQQGEMRKGSPAVFGRAEKDDYEIKEDIFKEFGGFVESMLAALPYKELLVCLDVANEYSREEDFQALSDYLNYSGISEQVQTEISLLEHGIEALGNWIQTTPEKLVVVLSLALNEDEDNAAPESAAWFAFVPKQSAAKQQANIQGYVFRQIELDYEDNEALGELVRKKYAPYALKDKEPSAMWLGNIAQDKMSVLLENLYASGLKFWRGKDGVEVLTTDRYFDGAVNSHWLVLWFALNSEMSGKDVLWLAGDQQKAYLGLVSFSHTS